MADNQAGLLLLKYLFCLALVLLLLFFLLTIVKKYLSIKNISSNTKLKIIERISIDQKQQLFLIDVGGELILLASAPNALHMCKLKDKDLK